MKRCSLRACLDASTDFYRLHFKGETVPVSQILGREPVWMQARTFTDCTSKGRLFQFHKSWVESLSGCKHWLLQTALQRGDCSSFTNPGSRACLDASTDFYRLHFKGETVPVSQILGREPVWMQALTFTDCTSKGRLFQFHKSWVNCQPLKNAMEQIKKRLHPMPNSHATSSVAFRLTIVPSPSTVARHWYSPLSESPPFSWTTLLKAREPFSSMYLEWPNKQGKEKCVKSINKQSKDRFHNNKKKWIHKCELQ